MSHIENKHCRLPLFEGTLLHSETMQQLLDFFQQNSQQCSHALGILRQLGKLGYQISKEIHPDYQYINNYYQKILQVVGMN